MKLEEKIDNALKSAIKGKDRDRLSTLRMLKADIESLFIEKKRSELKDEDIIKIIRTQIRKHRDSIEQFAKGGREDLVEKEKKELKVLEAYMPEGLSEEELKKMIQEAISETGAGSKKDMGKVMKAMMEKVKGRTDGKTISRIVASLLK